MFLLSGEIFAAGFRVMSPGAGVLAYKTRQKSKEKQNDLTQGRPKISAPPVSATSFQGREMS
ncbi:MAG: hypothetical protein M0Q93_01490 [Terrimicrobiaceae bacterium]|nr:hypothetical protein [Terrimicrobiaceae bacterium]